ncbi:hypothetical protein C7M84_014925 [Penaeus vannamei]|uniref:Uncharacterized protein n=1 Tax=Penaeus vannamei TaxID=6689 RepID=A0A3R7Q2R9_PENVA|nr:hypothetical protein C7M84_014925 [Penaeus vannamei]
MLNSTILIPKIMPLTAAASHHQDFEVGVEKQNFLKDSTAPRRNKCSSRSLCNISLRLQSNGRPRVLATTERGFEKSGRSVSASPFDRPFAAPPSLPRLVLLLSSSSGLRLSLLLLLITLRLSPFIFFFIFLLLYYIISMHYSIIYYSSTSSPSAPPLSLFFPFFPPLPPLLSLSSLSPPSFPAPLPPPLLPPPLIFLFFFSPPPFFLESISFHHASLAFDHCPPSSSPSSSLPFSSVPLASFLFLSVHLSSSFSSFLFLSVFIFSSFASFSPPFFLVIFFPCPFLLFSFLRYYLLSLTLISSSSPHSFLILPPCSPTLLLHPSFAPILPFYLIRSSFFPPLHLYRPTLLLLLHFPPPLLPLTPLPFLSKTY